MLKYAGVVEWQTRLTQNQEGNRGGSSPFTGTTRQGLEPICAPGFLLCRSFVFESGKVSICFQNPRNHCDCGDFSSVYLSVSKTMSMSAGYSLSMSRNGQPAF